MYECNEMQDDFQDDRMFGPDEDALPDEPEEMMTDVEADADTLASAGQGTDEDYGYYPTEEY